MKKLLNLKLIAVGLIVGAAILTLAHVALAQANNPKKGEESWRVGEKKFAELMEMERALKMLDDPSAPSGGELGFSTPPTGKAAQRTVQEIEKECGTPYASNTNKAGGRSVFYGRLGFETDDGKTIKSLWVVYSIEKVNKSDTKTMYYTVEANVVTIHNTPWGEHKYTMTYQPGAASSMGFARMGPKSESKMRIEYIPDPASGRVKSLTVDGKEVPKGK